MNKHAWWLCGIVLSLVLVACTAGTTATQAPTPLPVASPEATARPNPVVPTVSPSDTPVPPATEPPAPTAKPTEKIAPAATATLEPTQRPTRAAGGGPVALSPTPTQALGPLYPKSPIQPWKQADFEKAVKEVNDSMVDFRWWHRELFKGGSGNCDWYWTMFYNRWEAQPAFTGVPADWTARYYAYRTILGDARVAFAPINYMCLSGGLIIKDEKVRTDISAAVDALVARAGQLYAAVPRW